MENAVVRPQRRWTVDEVERLVAIGLLGEDEHIELIDGELVQMSPKGEEHTYVVDVVREELGGAYAGTAWVRQEGSLRVGDHSLPEPDVLVVRGGRRDYLSRRPTGADSLLVVEVSVSTLAEDRAKASLYARAGVPVYWIVDVDGRRAEVHGDPQPDGRYRVVEVLDEADFLVPQGTEARIALRTLLP